MFAIILCNAVFVYENTDNRNPRCWCRRGLEFSRVTLWRLHHASWLLAARFWTAISERRSLTNAWMVRSVYTTLGFYLCPPGAQCNRPSVSPTSAPPNEDVPIGLKPLASGAERARQTLLIPSVHYEWFVETIRNM